MFLPSSSVKACKWKTGLSLDQQEYLNERLKYDILMFETNKLASILEPSLLSSNCIVNIHSLNEEKAKHISVLSA